jgi:hypothetical protein
MQKYSKKIMQQKLAYLSPECPLGTLPPFAQPQAIQTDVIPEEPVGAQPLSSAAS